MSKNTSVGLKFIFSFLTFTILSTFLVLVTFSVPAHAQPGKDPNYKYPILTENDFNFYIKLVPHLVANKDSGVLLAEYNVTEEYAQAVLMKISLNAAAKYGETTSRLEQELGKSIIFNSSENALYDKYDGQIFDCLISLGIMDEGGE
jgi:hypothetical protein